MHLLAKFLAENSNNQIFGPSTYKFFKIKLKANFINFKISISIRIRT